MTLNLEQARTKFVPGSSRNQVQIDPDSVPIASSNDKTMMNATSKITRIGVFLTHAADLWGLNFKEFSVVKFPDFFTLTANEKHFSNEQESLKL